MKKHSLLHKLRPLLCSFCILALLASCQTPSRIQAPAISGYFQAATLPDTLHIEISDMEAMEGDTIPNHLFFSSIPSQLFAEIDHIADSTQALVLGRQFFPVEGNIAVYWVEIRQFWFQHHSLFLYDGSKKAFTDRVTVAEWYGGDGGQVLMGSWMFDYDGDGKKDIVRQEIQHSMVPTENEPLEREDASASLLLWKNGRFEDTPFRDTAAIIRQFPIRSNW